MVFPMTALANADETLAIAKEHHRGIVEAIAKRQGARAESLAREHGLIGRRVLELSLADASTLCRVPGASLINA
jgi:GntR family transcriptional regulator, vanillate catabolism transcriptional regulator